MRIRLRRHATCSVVGTPGTALARRYEPARGHAERAAAIDPSPMTTFAVTASGAPRRPSEDRSKPETVTATRPPTSPAARQYAICSHVLTSLQRVMNLRDTHASQCQDPRPAPTPTRGIGPSARMAAHGRSAMNLVTARFTARRDHAPGRSPRRRGTALTRRRVDSVHRPSKSRVDQDDAGQHEQRPEPRPAACGGSCDCHDNEGHAEPCSI